MMDRSHIMPVRRPSEFFENIKKTVCELAELEYLSMCVCVIDNSLKHAKLYVTGNRDWCFITFVNNVKNN